MPVVNVNGRGTVRLKKNKQTKTCFRSSYSVFFPGEKAKKYTCTFNIRRAKRHFFSVCRVMQTINFIESWILNAKKQNNQIKSKPSHIRKVHHAPRNCLTLSSTVASDYANDTPVAGTLCAIRSRNCICQISAYDIWVFIKLAHGGHFHGMHNPLSILSPQEKCLLPREQKSFSVEGSHENIALTCFVITAKSASNVNFVVTNENKLVAVYYLRR